jgi:undecaprenyl-diphosphatase
MDNTIFHFINSSLRNPFWDGFMVFLNRLPAMEIILAIALLMFIFGRKSLWRLGGSLFIGSALEYLSIWVLKISFHRPRPYLSLAELNLLMPREHTFSFPSGHATYAFMVATILFLYSKRFFWLYILAFLFAFSRIYVGLHYPSDVLVGMFLGIAIGVISSRLFKKK